MKHHLQRNLGYLLIGIGLLLAVGGIYGLTQPDEFRATARFFVEEDRSSFSRWCVPETEQMAELLKSDTVLSNAVWKLKATTESTSPTKAAHDIKTIGLLRERIDFRPIPNTRLFDISVTENDPKQAADSANLLVATYKTEILRRQNALITSGIRELKTQLMLQEQKATTVETELNRLRETLKLPTPEPPQEELETSFPAYYEVKKKLNDEKDIVGLLARKIRIEETDLQSPSNFPQIVIVETAVPPTSPMRRKKLLGAVLLLAGLGCCQWGLTVTRNAKLIANVA